jgi:hypothetical protein
MFLLRMQAAEGFTATLAKLAAPWADLYGDSKVISAAVTFLHLAPLIIAAGAAFAADRATLRVVREGPPERARQLKDLAAIHRVVLFGLALSVISGWALFFSDVETFLPSVFFWIKLILVGALLLNGFLMTRTEAALAKSVESQPLWSRMRTLALVSAFLWLATTLAGVVLTEFA